jgi:hypothetical protein
MMAGGNLCRLYVFICQVYQNWMVNLAIPSKGLAITPSHDLNALKLGTLSEEGDMKVLYRSSDVHKAIKEIFDPKYNDRIAIVAYLGVAAESFIPSPKGLRIICCPEPGATSPESIRSFIARGADVQFSDDLHAKVYWSKGGCVITSANISHRALGRSNQKEIGILLDSRDFDINRMLTEAAPYKVNQKTMNMLDRQAKKFKKATGIKSGERISRSYLDWINSPYKELWKMGWWSDSNLGIAKSALRRASTYYGAKEPFGVMNVAKNQVGNHQWILCFEIASLSIKNIEWMYVDFVVPVEEGDKHAYEAAFPFQSIQVHPLSQYPEPPFIITKEFRTAFKKALKEYGIERIQNAEKLSVPPSLQRKVADYLSGLPRES